MPAETLRPERVSRYNTTAITLHWIVAIFIILAVFAGLSASNADDSNVRRLVDLHKSLGLTALGLVVLRILWRLAHKPPPIPRAYSKVERVLAHAVHGTLYAVMLLLPLTGYIHDSAWRLAATHPIVLYGLVHFPRIGFIEALSPVTKEQIHEVFSTTHIYLSYVLYALLGLHVLGVAKHHAIDHQDELQRMLPATFERPSGAEEVSGHDHLV